MNLCKIGCDPEVMVMDVVSKTLVGAPEVVPGTKTKPHKLVDGAMHSDNVNLEFNTKPAVSSKDFVKVLGSVLKQTVRVVGPKYKLIVRASAKFPKSALKHPDTQMFGCESDFDAWRLCPNIIEEDAATDSFRTAGGHIHVGHTPKSKKLLTDDWGKVEVVKMMDAFVGVTSVLLDNDPTSVARRKLYGRSGAHRMKDYGVEYRAAGNFWISSPKLVEIIHGLTNLAVDICLKGKSKEVVEKISGRSIREVIDTSAKPRAKRIFKEVTSKYMGKELLDKIASVEGVNFDFYKEWNL